MNEKVAILNLETEKCDEDKIEVFAFPPLLNWALIPTHLTVIAQLEAERLWPWPWELLDRRLYRDVDFAPPYPGMGWGFRPNYGKNLLLQV